MKKGIQSGNPCDIFWLHQSHLAGLNSSVFPAPIEPVMISSESASTVSLIDISIFHR